MKILQKQGFIGLLLSITMLFSGINIPVLADNAEEISNHLITDGSFDTTTEIANGNWWGTPPDIGVWQYSGDNAVTVETDEKTSNKYVKMIAKTGLGQNVNVEANSDYVLTAKIKGSAATLNINNGTVSWPAKNGSSSLAYSDVAASEDWQTVTVEYSNESYEKLFVYLWVENGTIEIDDVMLTKKGEIPSNPNEIKVTANKTAQWTSQQAKENFDLRIHGWSEWENAAYMGFTLPESVTWNKIEKAELVITTTSVKNDANHTSFPKAWLYGADYSAFENGVQYEGTDNAPTYNTAEILEFDSPTVNGESKYDITEYIKTMKENNTAFRIDVKSQNSNNTWLIGSCTNGAKAPQLILTLKEETEPTTEPSGKPTTTPDIKPTDETINITADKTAQWIANSGDSKSYDLDIHGWETWETAAYIGFTLPDDFVPSEIGTAKLIVNTTSAAGSGPGRAYAAYYDGFDNGGYYEGVDRLPGYINTKTIAKFDTPDKNTTGDFEIDITSYIRGLGDAKNAAVRLDAESGQVNMRWKIGSCKTGTAPHLVLKKGEYTEPTPEPTEEPLTEPDAKPTAEFINLEFTDGLNGWTTSVKGDTVGSVSAENGTAILGNKSSVYQIANGLVQGSYTMNVWVKGTATGNTSYIRAEETGGPAAESKVDTFINSSGYTCISLRNVLVYNGQCKIKIFSGKGCSLTLDKVEFVLDSNDNNPVLNWGFENGLENWTTDGTVDIIETDADTGSKAAKLAPNSEISQTIAVKPNTRYIATVRAKVDTQDTWEKVETYYTDGANKGKKSGEYSVTLTNGDRINLGVRNASGVVLRQAPAGLEGYSFLTIAFKTGADDTSVTLYANTKYGDSYKNSVKVYGDGATGDAWTRNKGNAYIDNFDFFTREESVVLGIDVSYLPIIEDNNGKYYANGVQQDFLAIMSNRGVTAVNGMIFVHGGADAMKPGTNSVALTMPNGFDKYYWYEIAERAKALDMDYMANFMLSDVWMNAVSAYTPIDWMRWNKEKNIYENQTLDEMKTSMYNYI